MPTSCNTALNNRLIFPKEISLTVFFLFLFSFSSYRVGRLQNIKRKIKKLRQEDLLLNQLMSILQDECFNKKKMSMDEYKISMEEFRKHLQFIIQYHKIIVDDANKS